MHILNALWGLIKLTYFTLSATFHSKAQCSLYEVVMFFISKVPMSKDSSKQVVCLRQEKNFNGLSRCFYSYLFIYLFFYLYLKDLPDDPVIDCVESSEVGKLKTTQAHLLISKHLPQRWRTDVFISMVQSRHPFPFWRISLGPLHHCCFAICMSTWTNYETLICTSHNNTSSRGF